MERYTLKELKRLVRTGAAKDITFCNTRSDVPESYTQIGQSNGLYGCNGKLLQGESGRLYAITKRTPALFLF
jgi:hypothetical protein